MIRFVLALLLLVGGGNRAEAYTLPIPGQAFMECYSAILNQGRIFETLFGSPELLISAPDTTMIKQIQGTSTGLDQSLLLPMPPAIGDAASADGETDLDSLRAILAPVSGEVKVVQGSLQSLVNQVGVLRVSARHAQKLLASEPDLRDAIANNRWPDQQHKGLLLGGSNPPTKCSSNGMAGYYTNSKADAAVRFKGYDFGEEVRLLTNLFKRHATLGRIGPSYVVETLPSREESECIDNGMMLLSARCYLDRRNLFPGYFALRTAKREELKNGYSIAMIDDYRTAVDALTISIAEADRRHAAEFGVRHALFRPAAERHKARLDREAGMLAGFKAGLDQEAAELAIIAGQISDARTRVASDQNDIATTVGQRATLTERLASTRTAVTAATASVDEIDEKRQANEAARAAIVLDCGGASYAECSNQSAKDRYDQAVYANFEIAANLMSKLDDARDRLFTLQNMEMELLGELGMAGFRYTELSIDLAETRVLLGQLESEHRSRNAVYLAQLGRWTGLDTANRADLASATGLLGLVLP